MLEVNAVNTGYGEIEVLNDVSLEIGEGELRILLGPNGYGKSTLLTTICGLHQPT